MTRTMRRAVTAAAVLAALGTLAFKRSAPQDDPDVCLYWQARTVRWHAAQPLGVEGEEGKEDDRLAALRASFRTWEEPSCTDLRLVEGDRAERTIGFSRNARNQNVVLFRGEDSCARYAGEPCSQDLTCADEYDCWDFDGSLLAVTITTFDRCGRILDGDIEFNGQYAYTTADGPPCAGSNTVGCVAIDVQNTATHEIGHLLGLDHPVGQPDATMHESAPPGETRKRDLSLDDIDGLCTIYPVGRPPDACVPADTCEPRTQETGCCHVSGGEASLLAAALVVAGLRRRNRGAARRRG